MAKQKPPNLTETMTDMGRAGRPSWISKIPDGAYELLRQRARAMLAGAFAAGPLSPHPWDHAGWRPVAQAVCRIMSLYMQVREEYANNENASVAHDVPAVKFSVIYSAPTESDPPRPSKPIVVFPNSDEDRWDGRTGSQITCEWRLDEGHANDQNGTGKVEIFYIKTNVPDQFWELVESELSRQLRLLTVPYTLKARPNSGSSPPETIAERLWDLRTRFGNFLYRFLRFYDPPPGSPLAPPDPLLVFFVTSRSLKAGRFSRHIQSGLLGHSYRLDDAQIDVLEEAAHGAAPSGCVQQTLIRDGYLQFPDGLCTKVYLTGRPAAKLTTEITDEYKRTSKEFAEAEKSIVDLGNRSLLEIPVYDATSDMATMPDGPEFILCVALPKPKEEARAEGENNEVQEVANTSPSPVDAKQPLFEQESVREVLARLTRAPDGSSFFPGEAQIVTEMGQWLATRYWTLPGATRMPEGRFVGKSQQIAEVRKTIQAVARSDCPVLILGETGTGKELVAQEIYHSGNRCNNPLIVLNCAAIPEALAESELFGHEKGAFTDARGLKQGKFELANGGTLFLDEIGDLSLDCQAKLLRALQENRITRVGGVAEISVDVRVIAATNRDLNAMIAQGRFRADLWYRINAVWIDVPPLRERTDDIIPLALHFIEQKCQESGRNVPTLSDGAVDKLKSHSWPGNVRELVAVITRILVFNTSRTVEANEVVFPGSARKGASGSYADGVATLAADTPASISAALPGATLRDLVSELQSLRHVLAGIAAVDGR